MTFDNKPSKTYTFQPSTVAKASEVNQNFDDAFGVYDTNGFIYGGWYPLVGAELEYHSATAVKTTTDVDLTGIIQAGDKLTFENSNIPGVTLYYIVTEVYYNYITSNRTLIFVHSVGAEDGQYFPVANEPIIPETVGFSRLIRPYGIPSPAFNGNASNGLIEGKIVRSVSSNDLFVKIATPSKEDPSPQNPVGIYIDGGMRYITSETSFTASAGTNWLNMGSAELATREVDLFVYIRLVKTGNFLEVIVSRIPYANRMGDFTNSGTSEKGVLNIASTYAAGDPVILVGRFAATLSAGAGYTWSVPTADENTLVQRPIYETRWFSPDPVVVGFSGTPTKNMRCRLQMNTLQISFDVSGTSNATNFTVTSPFIFNNPSACNNVRPGYSEDNGVALAASRVDFVNGTRVMNIFSSGGGGTWTASGPKRAMAQFFVEI